MPTKINSYLFVDLSTEQQEVLAGGQYQEGGLGGGQLENDQSDGESPSSCGDQGFPSSPSTGNQYLIRGIVSLQGVGF